MPRYTLDDIKKIVDELSQKINAPTKLLPSYGRQTWDAHPYIEVDSMGSMFYVNSERGQEFERRMTDKIDDLLYWIFADVTWYMAFEHNQKNRIEDKDGRRIMFDKQEELLGQLNYDWREKEIAKHQSILRSYPFDDLAGLRATYFGQLRQQGLSESEIGRLAYEKYPK